MNRVVLTLLVLVSVGFTVVPAQAFHNYEKHQCGYHWKKNTKELIRMVRCLAEKRNSPGGGEKAIQVFSCESGLNPRAYNPAGPYLGLGQQVLSSWSGRAARYGYPRASAYNGRANADVSIKMARDARTWSGHWPSCGA